MVIIHYPEPGFRIKKQAGKDYIFDALRKKWLLLTPEEWVRQNFVQYLLLVKGFPASLIALEKVIKLGELKKRFDILVYDNNHRPWMMIECKAGEVGLDEKTMEQVLRYNISIPVEYIVITNGGMTHAWQRKNNTLVVLDDIPARI